MDYIIPEINETEKKPVKGNWDNFSLAMNTRFPIGDYIGELASLVGAIFKFDISVATSQKIMAIFMLMADDNGNIKLKKYFAHRVSSFIGIREHSFNHTLNAILTTTGYLRRIKGGIGYQITIPFAINIEDEFDYKTIIIKRLDVDRSVSLTINKLKSLHE